MGVNFFKIYVVLVYVCDVKVIFNVSIYVYKLFICVISINSVMLY